MITKGRAVNIYVTDQDRALAFYRDVLGFEVVMDTPMGDMGPPGHENKRWIAVSRRAPRRISSCTRRRGWRSGSAASRT